MPSFSLHQQLVLVFFWQKNIGGKAARKMLVKLTPDRRTVITSRKLFRTVYGLRR